MRNRTAVVLLAVLFFMTVSLGFARAAVIYNVQAKDTLWKIAKENGVSMDSLLKANPELGSENNLKAGMVLMIPDKTEDIIPLDDEATETTTLVVHGAKSQNVTAASQAVNVMTVDGKTMVIPTRKPVRKARERDDDSSPAPYRSKYHKMSSRGYMPLGANGIVKAAFRFMGVPYVFGGTTPNGFDCSGFVQYVYAMNGVKTPRMAHHQYYAGTPIKKDQLRPGDLVFFETYCPGISHVGIYIGNSNFIHASSAGCVRISSLNEQYYINHYRAAARY